MIRIKELTKIYQPGKPNQAIGLNRVNILLPNKGIIFVVGRSGSGKSTLLHLLGGMDQPTSGQIDFDGTNVGCLNYAQQERYRASSVGFCFQNPELIPHFTVEKNIRIVNPKLSDSDVDRLLSSMGLNGLQKRKAFELSGGQAQRVAIARALAKDPPLLLADEPTGSLDEESANAVFRILKTVSSGRLVVISTHDIKAAEAYGDRIVELVDGKVNSERVIHTTEGPATEHFSSVDGSASFRFQLACSSLLMKKKRTVASCFLLALSFGIFGALVGSATANKEDLVANSLSASSSGVCLAKTANAHEGHLSRINMIEDEVRAINDAFGEGLNVYDGHSSFAYGKRFSPNDYCLSTPEANSLDAILGSNYQGFVVASASLEYSGIHLVGGTLPSSENECLLPILAYQEWQKYGFQSEGKIYRPSGFPEVSAFLESRPTIYAFANGATIPLSVSGFVETGFDASAYTTIGTGNGFQAGLMTNRLANELAYGLHQLLYVHASFVDQYCLGAAVKRLDHSFTYQGDGYQQAALVVGKRDEDVCVSINTDDDNGVYLPCGSFGDVFHDCRFSEQNYFSKDYRKCSFILSEFDGLPLLEQGYDAGYLFSEADSRGIGNFEWIACGDYVANHGISGVQDTETLLADAQAEIDKAYEAGEISRRPNLSDGTTSSLSLLKSFYLRTLVANHPNSFMEKRYGSLNKYQIMKELASRIVGLLPENRSAVFQFDSQFTLDRHNVDIPVAGLRVPLLVYDASTFLFGSGGYRKLNPLLGLEDDYAFVFHQTPKESKTARSMLAGINQTKTRISAQHYIIGQYYYLGDFFWNYVSWIVVLLASIFGLVALALMALSLRASSVQRRREFAIRRSMGLSRMGAFADLLTESLILEMAGFVFSIPVSILAVFVCNRWISGLSLANLSLFWYGPLALGFVFFTMTISCALIAFPLALSGTKTSLAKLLQQE